MSKKQNMIYKKNPCVGIRHTRRRVVLKVNDILSAITNSNENINKEFNNTSIQDINVYKVNDTIDIINDNMPYTNNSFNIDCKFSFSCDNFNTTNNTSNLFNINNDTQFVEILNSNIELSNNESNDKLSNKDFPLADTNLICKLREWAINGNVPHIRISELLHILWLFHPELPLSSKTLLNTPLVLKSKKLNNGEYYHFNLITSLKRILTEHDLFCCEDIKL